MNRKPVVATAVVCLLLSCSADAFAQGRRGRGSEQAAVENGWHFNYADAKEIARKTRQPLMVVFRCVP